MADIAERLRQGVQHFDDRDDAVMRQAADEIERLRGLIQAHNDGCEQECLNRPADHCEPYTDRGRRCPDCPMHQQITTVQQGEGP